MTYKQLADKLGVKKDRVRYLAEHLTIPDAIYRVDGVIHMSDAAVKLIIAEIEEIPQRDSAVYTCVHTEEPRNNTEETCENHENSEKSRGTTESIYETANNDHENLEASLTIIDQYKTVVRNQLIQLAAKDEQIKRLTDLVTIAQETAAEQVTAAQTAATEQIIAAQAAASEQLAAKDTQIQRLQDTIDALTRQLEEAHEPQKKWWQFWK